MPLHVIESTDPLTDLISLKTSAIYEMIFSLQLLLKPNRRAEWVSHARASLPAALLDELDALYRPYGDGALFVEMAVNYTDHDDVPGFIEYVRHMDPVMFVFHVVGRILTPEQIAQTGLDVDVLTDALHASPFDTTCLCTSVPMDRILDDVPAFQHRLADLWQDYWDVFFGGEIAALRPHWEDALADKSSILARSGGQALYEHVTGRSELLPMLPDDYPYTDIVFIPIYLTPSPVMMFYGYGNITVLFDSERTEARMAEIERSKERILGVFKALGDSSRLDILRLVALHGDKLNGKKIASKLNLSASAVSRHLGQLKDAGLIIEESSDNRTITYRVQPDALSTLPDALFDYLYH